MGEAADPPELLHWGDIDLGGIRIFQLLQSRFFPGLRPYRMDAETLLRYEAQAAPVSDEYADRLRQALDDPRYAQWLPVFQVMLERRIRLEQESIAD